MTALSRTLQFEACERGFIFTDYRISSDARRVFAFDKIEDAAAWLVECHFDMANCAKCGK